MEMIPSDNSQQNNSSPVSPAFRLAVNRFVSTLSAAFRAFYLYKQDNRAFDEIMTNLARRFQETVPPNKLVKLGITNRSFLFEGEPTGYKEITIYLSNQLRALGYKEIKLLAPIQSRNFFQMLHVLSLKDSDESKNDKLVSLLDDGEPKPISLVPITSNSTVMRLTDQLITLRLTALSVPDAMGGTGFLEKMTETRLDTLPDMYTWICLKVDPLASPVRTFSRNITDATREGYFPFDRYLRLFPLPRKFREDFKTRTETPTSPSIRKPTALGHRFLKIGKKKKNPSSDWLSLLTSFSEEEAKAMQLHRVNAASASATLDIDLAESLLNEPGPNFILGLCLLLRCMTDKNPVAVQEKALKIAVETWAKYQMNSENIGVVTLLSSLRQSLTDPHNIILSLFPVRNATMDSNEFKKTTGYLLSLGKAVTPSLINALEAEQDRSMRKKLCHIITIISKEYGIETLVSAIPRSSPFLLRNIIMILGDIKHPLTVSDLTPLIRHGQKMVRVEAVRTLCKIGTDEIQTILLNALEHAIDPEVRQLIVDYLTQKKFSPALDVMMRMAKHPSSSGPWRRSLYSAIAFIGGSSAREFLAHTQKEGTFMTRFNPEQKEDMELIKTLLGRMEP